MAVESLASQVMCLTDTYFIGSCMTKYVIQRHRHSYTYIWHNWYEYCIYVSFHKSAYNIYDAYMLDNFAADNNKFSVCCQSKLYGCYTSIQIALPAYRTGRSPNVFDNNIVRNELLWVSQWRGLWMDNGPTREYSYFLVYCVHIYWVSFRHKQTNDC